MEDVNVGIDLGGSHIAIGVVDSRGAIIEQFEKDFTVEEKKNLIHVAKDFIVKTVNDLKSKYRFFKIGIGMAGAISNGVILRSVNLGVENYDLRKVLEEELELDVRIKNDAKCAAIAEYKFGDISKYKNVLFMTLGTGIGGAYIYHGELMEGTCFEGLEFGHMIIKAGGIKCKCGKFGCFEKYGSILTFKSKVIERLNLSHNISGPDLRKSISEHEEEITDIKEEYINDLAIGISNLINIFEPDIVVIGGGFARYDYMLLSPLKEKILRTNFLFNRRDDIVIKAAKLGNDAGIIGASIL